MKTIVTYIFLMLTVLGALAQEPIVMKFYISNKGGNPVEKVQLKIHSQSYTVKANNPLTFKITPNYKSPLQINFKASSIGEVSYFFIPYPGQSYEFELTNTSGQLQVTLVNSESVKLGLIEGVDEKSITDNQKKQEEIIINRKNLSLGYTLEKEGTSNIIREEWLRLGGKVKYLSVGALVSYYSMDMDEYGTMNGFGGGISAAINQINLVIPEYTTGKSKWNSLNYGMGLDLQIYSSSLSMQMGGIKSDMKISNVDFRIMGNIGWTWGFGRFRDKTTWKGVAITAKYRPSLNLTLSNTEIKMDVMGDVQKITDSNGSSKFNFGGFGFDFDFNSFSAKMEKIAPKPSSKVSVFLLPPIGENPLFVSLSYGLTFYTK